MNFYEMVNKVRPLNKVLGVRFRDQGEYKGYGYGKIHRIDYYGINLSHYMVDDESFNDDEGWNHVYYIPFPNEDYLTPDHVANFKNIHNQKMAHPGDIQNRWLWAKELERRLKAHGITDIEIITGKRNDINTGIDG